MEQITPELERRLQVEELWARRNVLADSMNAWRRERFRAQRSLLARFGTQDGAAAPSRDGASRNALAPRARAARDKRPLPDEIMTTTAVSRGHGLVWLSGIAAMAAAALLLNANMSYAELIDHARDSIGVYVPYLKPAATHRQAAALAVPSAVPGRWTT